MIEQTASQNERLFLKNNFVVCNNKIKITKTIKNKTVKI